MAMVIPAELCKKADQNVSDIRYNVSDPLEVVCKLTQLYADSVEALNRKLTPDVLELIYECQTYKKELSNKQGYIPSAKEKYIEKMASIGIDARTRTQGVPVLLKNGARCTVYTQTIPEHVVASSTRLCFCFSNVKTDADYKLPCTLRDLTPHYRE